MLDVCDRLNQLWHQCPLYLLPPVPQNNSSINSQRPQQPLEPLAVLFHCRATLVAGSAYWRLTTTSQPGNMRHLHGSRCHLLLVRVRTIFVTRARTHTHQHARTHTHTHTHTHTTRPTSTSGGKRLSGIHCS
jgi:hypothetical protein